jgi:hypothetical protein
LANPSVPLQLPEEKPRIYRVWNVRKTLLIISKEYLDNKKIFYYKRFTYYLPIFLIGKIWPNFLICQTLGFSILSLQYFDRFKENLDRQRNDQQIPLGSLINRLNDFCKWLRIRRAIRKFKSLRAMHHCAESIFKVDFLREYESIFETALAHESVGPMGTVWRKNQRSKISCYCPFKL